MSHPDLIVGVCVCGWGIAIVSVLHLPCLCTGYVGIMALPLFATECVQLFDGRVFQAPAGVLSVGNICGT